MTGQISSLVHSPSSAQLTHSSVSLPLHLITWLVIVIYVCSFHLTNFVCAERVIPVRCFLWLEILMRWRREQEYWFKWEWIWGVTCLSQRPACHVQHQSCSFAAVLFHPPFPLVLWRFDSLIWPSGKCSVWEIHVCYAQDFTHCLFFFLEFFKHSQKQDRVKQDLEQDRVELLHVKFTQIKTCFSKT